MTDVMHAGYHLSKFREKYIFCLIHNYQTLHFLQKKPKNVLEKEILTELTVTENNYNMSQLKYAAREEKCNARVFHNCTFSYNI